MVLGWFGELVGGLGGKFVVWGSIRLAWVVLGWFVMVNGLGWYWVGLVVNGCLEVISGGLGDIRLGLW